MIEDQDLTTEPEIEPADLKQFFQSCAAEKARIEVALPDDCIIAGLGRKNNPEDHKAILAVYQYIEDHEQEIIGRTDSGKKAARFAKEATALTITFHITRLNGKIILVFDYNSKFTNYMGWFEFWNVLSPTPYSKKKIIGSGGQSFARKSAGLDGGSIVPLVTVVNKKNYMQPRDREQKIMGLLPPNPFVIATAFSETYTSKLKQNKLVSFSPLMNGDLRQFLGRATLLNLENTLWMIHSLISGLKHLHHHGILHRDLKTRNCFYNEDQHGITVVIADMGMAEEESAINKDTHFSGAYKFLAFDNPYFSTLILELKNLRQKGEVSKEEFLAVVNNCKRSNQRLFREDVQSVTQIKPIEILWEKRKDDFEIKTAETYAHRQEDVTGLLYVIEEVLIRFGKGQKAVPPIANKFFKHIRDQLRLGHSQRGSIDELHTSFVEELNAFIKNQSNSHSQTDVESCRALFQLRSKQFKTVNPITVEPIAESKKLSTPVDTHGESSPPPKPVEPTTESPVAKIPAETQKKEVVATENTQHLKALINSYLWADQTTWGFGIPDGIHDMRNIGHCEDSQLLSKCKEIVTKRSKVKNCCFFRKRDPFTGKFYQSIEKSHSIAELNQDSDFKAVYDEFNRRHTENLRAQQEFHSPEL